VTGTVGTAVAAQPPLRISGQTAVGVALVGLLAVMVLPLPPLALDLLLATSFSLSLVVFLAALQVERPVEFSVFPTLLLVLTLLRLSLNVASTRVILLHGDQGPQAAGSVIAAFGQFVVGGNYVVGFVVFLILVIINFVVITKGAGRIAEVAARFVLDAMPGKQMAVDAELAAGAITDKEARRRRRGIEQEADFYGAMDGASKFVRGDAVAGLLITAINVVGGIVIGVAQRDMAIGEAARTFTILSVGDGLVTQIPALLVSTAAGLVTSRAAADGELGPALGAQIFRTRRPAAIAGGLLGGLGLLPGMPHLAFLTLGAVLGVVAWKAVPRPAGATAEEQAAPLSPAQSERAELEALLSVDLLEIQLGYELLPLVDSARGGELLGRIGAIRRQFAQDMGVMVPAIHVRDNLRLPPSEYRVLLSGNVIGRGTLRMERLLAMNPTGGGFEVPGEATREPAFGLAALWISSSERERAEMSGYTVVDPPSVLATHLTELLRGSAHELLGRREAQELLDVLARSNPKVVEELIPHLLPLGEVVKVLRGLLREGVSIRDLRSILEALADHASHSKDPGELIELVRERLAKHITARYRADDGAVYALVLDPDIEAVFRQSQRPVAEGGGLDGRQVPRLLGAFEAALRELARSRHAPLLVCAPDLRRTVSSFAHRHAGGMTVLSYREIETGTPVRTLGVVRPKGGDA
jgi:flagellar biosynthesis protein FlhA